MKEYWHVHMYINAPHSNDFISFTENNKIVYPLYSNPNLTFSVFRNNLNIILYIFHLCDVPICKSKYRVTDLNKHLKSLALSLTTTSEHCL